MLLVERQISPPVELSESPPVASEEGSEVSGRLGMVVILPCQVKGLFKYEKT